MDEERLKQAKALRALLFALGAGFAVIGGFRYFASGDFPGLAEDVLLGLCCLLAGFALYTFRKEAIGRERENETDPEDDQGI